MTSEDDEVRSPTIEERTTTEPSGQDSEPDFTSPNDPLEEKVRVAMESALDLGALLDQAIEKAKKEGKPLPPPRGSVNDPVYESPEDPISSWPDWDEATPSLCRTAMWRSRSLPDTAEEIAYECGLGPRATALLEVLPSAAMAGVGAPLRDELIRLAWTEPLPDPDGPPTEVDPLVTLAAVGGVLELARRQQPLPSADDTADHPSRNLTFEGTYLPAEFWEARPVLGHIRDAAYSRGRSPDAVLGAVLARLAADTDHNIQLPPLVGSAVNLSLIVAPTGPPASGKSTTIAIANELVPATRLEPEADQVTLGSGEGLMELLHGFVPDPNDPKGKQKVHQQVRHNAFAVLDEGEVANIFSQRGTSSILLPTLRTLFTSGPLGTANATQEKKRRIPAGQAAFGVVIAIQPDLVGPLFGDAGAGTPQRFLWAATTAPTPEPESRPDWPGPLPRKAPPATVAHQHEKVSNPGGYNRVFLRLPDEIKLEVARRDHQRQLGKDNRPLDEHTDLISLKVAGLLAVLDGRLEVTLDDWVLAETVVESSRRVRDRLQAHLRARDKQRDTASAEKAAYRQTVVQERVASWQTTKVAQKVTEKVRKEPGKWTPGKLRGQLSQTQRDHFETALEHAVAQGWVHERDEDTEGGTSRRLWPGRAP